MPSINVLPTFLVNKIAAGEVIERPASVVKELVENAIDAGASRIEIVVEDGGKKRITVSDDGVGMGPDDLELAFVPHATSKIAGDDDLFRIETMGFRGEALASVASISHAHIRSRLRDAEGAGGYEIDASAQTVAAVKPCPAPAGTSVTVRDLFYNTPARRKFLRTTGTELGHVTEQMTRLALPHPRIAFRMVHNNREIHNLPPAETTAARATDLFGPELGESLIPLVPRGGAIRVEGLVAPPSAARGSGKWQYFFLNGRYVRDRLLAHALREAYRGLIDPSRYPVALIFLEVDPADVDVNVHPTKIEVRFRDSQAVHGTLMASLKETLNRACLTPDASLDRTESDVSDPTESTGEGDPEGEARRQSLRKALADFFKSAPPPPARLNFPKTEERGPRFAGDNNAAEPSPRGPLLGPRPHPSTRQEHVPAPPHGPDPCAQQAELPVERSAPASAPAPPVLQIHESYIVTECPEGLVIVDQHALHERILYNQFRDRLSEGSLTSQPLLIPETMRVSGEESAILESHCPLLERLGIHVEAFGPETIALQRFPALLLSRSVDARAFLRDLLDALREDDTTDGERVLEEVLAMMACKAAVKANHLLSAEEMHDLLERGQAVEKSSSCPHGRPTTLRMTLSDLARQFKRT